MTTPVNLNKVRKERQRAEKKARADANAIAFGRTKAARKLADAQKAKAETHLSHHKLEE